MSDALMEIAKKLVHWRKDPFFTIKIGSGDTFQSVLGKRPEHLALEAKIHKLKPHKAALVMLMVEELEAGSSKGSR